MSEDDLIEVGWTQVLRRQLTVQHIFGPSLSTTNPTVCGENIDLTGLWMEGGDRLPHGLRIMIVGHCMQNHFVTQLNHLRSVQYPGEAQCIKNFKAVPTTTCGLIVVSYLDNFLDPGVFVLLEPLRDFTKDDTGDDFLLV